MSELELFDPSYRGLQMLAELERTGAITETSLQLPPDVDWDVYESLAYLFGRIHRQSAWVIGDLLNYGEAVYGEKYAQAAESTGLAQSTLENYCSVCNRVPRSRRRKQLAFSIHAEVASLSPTEQTEWLSKAAREGWKRGRIREELAPRRAAAALEQQRKHEARQEMLHPTPPAPIITDSGAEVFPPAVEPELAPHICHCFVCGRDHRDDVDVTE